MIIKVRRKHILNRKRKQGGNCPIALALKDSGFEKPHVSTEDVDLAAFECRPLSIRAQRFIVRFDEGLPVKPFSFRIRPLK